MVVAIVAVIGCDDGCGCHNDACESDIPLYGCGNDDEISGEVVGDD